jgi:flagella basal body P-ring formation protein FlgA
MKTAVNIIILFAVITAVVSVSAAEIRLKKGPVSCSGNFVLLGDVADIIPNRNGENIEQLRQTVLFPVPRSGEQRVITPIELRNLFAHIGIKSIEHQFSGAMKTVVGNNVPVQNPLIRQASYLKSANAEHNGIVSANAANAVNSNTMVSPKLIQTLEKQLAEAINVYLDSITQEENGKNKARKITVKLNAEQSHRLATGGKIVEITGGQAPFLGKQKFEIQMSRADSLTQRNVTVNAEADITETQKVLSASRSLPKGHIINESDLTLTAVENNINEDGFTKASEILGMETTASVREKSAFSAGVLKRPAWVKKGDVVSVRSINNGIIVKTNGIAQEDGAENDTVLVSILDTSALKNNRQNKKNEQPAFTARVSQPKTVEVYAGTVTVNNE